MRKDVLARSAAARTGGPQVYYKDCTKWLEVTDLARQSAQGVEHEKQEVAFKCPAEDCP